MGKTREDILKKHFNPATIGYSEHSSILEAMKEYAREVAIAVKEKCSNSITKKEVWDYDMYVTKTFITEFDIEEFIK